MATFQDRVPENVGDYFYVDQECIACDTCGQIAPDHFRLTNNSQSAYVFHQPTTSQQIERCKKALTDCPVEAIGIHQ